MVGEELSKDLHKPYKFRLLNSFSCDLSTTSPLDVTYTSKFETDINGIYYNGSPVVELFQHIPFNIGKDNEITIIPRFMKKESEQWYKLYADLPSVTSLYIAPLIFGFRVMHSIAPITQSYYSYLDPYYKDGDQIILVMQYGNAKSLQIENKFVDFSHFRESINIDKYRVAIVFDIQSKYLEDVRLLRESQYSKISESAKLRIIEYYRQLRNISNPFEADMSKTAIYKMLYKDNDYRELLNNELNVTIPKNQELGEKFNADRATFYMDRMAVDYDESRSKEELIISHKTV